MRPPVRLSLAWLLAFAAAGCAPKTLITGAFTRPTTLRSGDVLAKIDEPPARQDAPAMVGVTEDGHLFLWSFEGGLQWRLDVEATSAPLLAGPIVVTQEGDRVVARTVENGAELFVVDEDEARLVGADSAGGLSVVAVQFEDRNGSERGMVVAARGGKIVWETELSRSVGTPAVVDGHVVVPWGTLHISLLDAANGTEAQRVDLRDSVAGHALVDRGHVYVGQHGLLKVDRSLEAGTRKNATYYSPVARPLPGQPGLMRDAYEPVHPPSHAGHRVRLDFRAAMEKEAFGLQDGLLYMHFYSFVFALDAERDAVRWLYQGSDDVVGTRVVPGGMYLVDTAGQVAFVNALGHVTWRVDAGVRPVVAVLRPPTTPPAAKADAEGEAADADFKARPLQQQLRDAARLDDARLAGGRAFAVEHLSRFDGEEITEYLLSLCDDPGAPDMVRAPACRGLGERREGKGPVLAALGRRASHRDRVPPPPVGPLARASASMGLKKAGPLLIAHVTDPHTPTRELAPALDALAALRHRPAAGPIEGFVRMHHAEPRNAHLAQALKAGLGALVALKGKAAGSLLDEVAADGLSMPGIAAHARQLAEELRAPKAKKGAAKKAGDKAKEPKKPEVEAPKIRYLSMGVVAGVLRPSDRKLRRCLTGDSAAGARVSMVVHGDGHIERTFVTPASAQQCVDKALAKVRFPASSQGRQQVVHVVRGKGKGGGKPAKRQGKSKRVQLKETN